MMYLFQSPIRGKVDSWFREVEKQKIKKKFQSPIRGKVNSVVRNQKSVCFAIG